MGEGEEREGLPCVGTICMHLMRERNRGKVRK